MSKFWKIPFSRFVYPIAAVMLALIPVLVTAQPLAQGTPEPYPGTDIYPAEVTLVNQDQVRALNELQIDAEGARPVDGIRDSGGFEPVIVTVYINPAQADALAQAGLEATPIANEGYRSFLAYGPGSGAPDAWPTFAQYEDRMELLEATYPQIVDLTIIGYSVQNRPLYCMEVTDNPGVDEYEPEFKYTANHHGDETTGVEMTMRFAELLAESYGSDPTLTELVDSLEIWLCPIYNPDGYVAGNRENAHGQDLNRDFPDRIDDPVDDPTGREPETQAFMNFGYNHRFVMGANYHGGAQVLNYPWDALFDYPPAEYAPDDQLFWDFGYGYTSRNTDLWNGGWDNGMTRGWEWYYIYGGMQDWAYLYRGEHHVTIEISDYKMPPFEQMDIYWDHNEEAMIWWIQRALTGMAGLVLDARDGTPLDATLTLVGRDAPNTIRTDPQVGDYHRVISEGTYNLSAAAAGYVSAAASVTVTDDQLTSTDFYLCPAEPFALSGTVTDAYSGLPLAAAVELVGSPLETATDPVTGQYELETCPAAYTMRVSALGYASQERAVTVDHSQVQDFALYPVSSLGESDKLASAEQAGPLDAVQYQLLVVNAGAPLPVVVTDTLPAGMTFTGYLTATQGTPVFAEGQILWQGEVNASEPVTITYELSVDECQPGGAALENVAEFSDGINDALMRTHALTVLNVAPSMPAAPYPPDGAGDLPSILSLAWAASTDPNCDAITYDLYFGDTPTPPLLLAGLSVPSANPGLLQPDTTYYWTVVAHDGQTTTSGPVWSFTTEPVTVLIRLLLPVVVTGAP